MHTFPLSEYMRYIEVVNWETVASLMLSSSAKLAKTGADFILFGGGMTMRDNQAAWFMKRLSKEFPHPVGKYAIIQPIISQQAREKVIL